MHSVGAPLGGFTTGTMTGVPSRGVFVTTHRTEPSPTNVQAGG